MPVLSLHPQQYHGCVCIYRRNFTDTENILVFTFVIDFCHSTDQKLDEKGETP